MSFKKFVPFLVPVALLATPACAADKAAARPDLDPAVWVVKDKDTTIYLFGTVHALDGKKDWFNDEVKASFDKSDELVTEIIMPEKPEELQPLVMKYGIDLSGKTLPSKLSPQGQKNLSAAIAQSGLPATAFDYMKPFLASITLTTLQFQKMGMGPENGAEKVLTTAAKAANKKTSALETADYQLGLFGALPEAEQVRMLEKGLEESAEVPAKVGKLVDAWGKADTETVGRIMEADDADSELLHKVLITDRNANWATWISKRLDQPGTVFVAVGAGHLAGKDSVQSLLKAKGIASARVPHKE
ncbi:TraB/GumN family protein [Sphingomonas jaspsi]|uniref:TraB/GumN family protein n=1 Tax=Sphingomonas jaspsi TaxID=392409 RepID=UPI0004B2EC35|nr:TraB/GumN family protein [Sphingomonas jaspsi]